jgi:hypothetical protein
MSVNRVLPHVLVLPEDDANRQLTNGFYLENDQNRQMQVLRVAVHSAEMDRWPRQRMVLLIDFYNVEGRLPDAKARIPVRLTRRVFILGVLSKPEDLKADLGAFEKIGLAMARDCREETNTTWGHDLLRHNANELDRLRQNVRPILFPSI